MIRNIFGRVIAVVVLLASPIFVMVAACSEQVAVLLYGSKFAPSGPLLQILCIYLGLRAIGTVSGGILVSLGRPGLSNFGWIGAYSIIGIGLAMGALTRDVYTATKWITAGAAFAFVTTVACAWLLIRPKVSDLTSALRALALNLALAGVIFVLSMTLAKTTAFLACAGTVGLIYPFAVTLALGGKPKDLFSKQGFKRLWDRV